MKKVIIAVVALAVIIAATYISFTYFGRSTGIALNITNPEIDTKALDYLVSDEEYQKSILGENIQHKSLTDKEIDFLFKKYYDKQTIESYQLKYNRSFEQDFIEYAKEAYRITSGRHVIGSPIYSLSEYDNALIANGVITEDIIDKVTDLSMNLMKSEFGYDNQPLFEKTRFLKEKRAIERETTKENLNKIGKREKDKEVVQGGSKTLLTLDKKGKSVELKNDYKNNNYLAPLNEDFINNVNENQYSIYEGEVPDVDNLPIDNLKEVFDYGITGIYKLNSEELGTTPLEYIQDNTYDLLIFLDYDERFDGLQSKYKGFYTGSLKSGVSFRLSQELDKVNSNEWILEVAYIDEITDILGTIPYQEQGE